MLSPADAEFARRDAALPGLAVALDPERALALLREAWPDLDARSARSTYLRYKPSTNCVVGWTVTTGTGELQSYLKTYAGPIPRRALAAAAVEGGLVRSVPAAYGIACRLPADLKMTALAGALAGPAKVLRYKPERRMVAQVHVSGRTALLKVYAPAEYPRSTSVQAELPAVDGLRLQRRLHRDHELAAAWYEWLEGETLAHGASCEAFARTGAALAAFHRAPAPASWSPLAPALARAKASARAVALTLPRLAADLDAALAALGGPPPTAVAPTATHGDFSPGQVLISADGPAFLDFDGAGLADPGADLGCFLASQLRDELATGAESSRERAAFLDGYRAADGPACARSIAWHTAAALLCLAPEPLRYRLADWPAATRGIVLAAREATRAL